MANRSIAHYTAADLTRAIIQQDTCRQEFLAETRQADIDETFRRLAGQLGYRVEKINDQTSDGA